MHRLIAVDRVQCALYRSEPEARGDALLNETMILFDHVVHLRTPPTLASSAQLSAALQLRNRVCVRLVAVYIDDPWTNPGAAAQRELQKELGRNCVTLWRQREIDSIAR